MQKIKLTDKQFKIIFLHLTLSLGLFRLCGEQKIEKKLLSTLEYLNSYRNQFGSSKKDLICIHEPDEHLGFDIHLSDGNPLSNVIEEELLPSLLIPALVNRDILRKFSEEEIFKFDKAKIKKEIYPIFDRYTKEFYKNGLDNFDFF